MWLFQSVGTLYTNIPFDNKHASVAAATVITVLTPLFLECKRVIRRLNGRQLDSLGASGARFIATKKMDPMNYPDEDREGLKRVTMKSEAIIDSVPWTPFLPAQLCDRR